MHELDEVCHFVMGLLTWTKHKLEENLPTSLSEAITKVEGFSNVEHGEKSEFKKENKFLHKTACHEREWSHGQNISKGEKPKQFQSLGSKPKSNFVKKRVPLKRSQPKGDASGKPKGTCFNYNEVGHYSKDYPKPKLGNGGFKVIALTTNLAQSKCNRIFKKKGRFLSEKCYVFKGLPTIS